MSFLQLFPHQEEALRKLNTFFCDDTRSAAGIICIPTGGGKTFTAVQWLLSVLKKSDSKIIWLAQSYELLNQAYLTFKDNWDEQDIKVISSHTTHSSVKDITGNEKILIITTQTAILAMKKEGSQLFGYIDNIEHSNFVVILDEAHHAPAYGCRNLLMDMKERIDRLWLLGLTATPTYTDKRRRGWLWKIFDGGIIYQVEKALLQKQRILAKEKIIRKKTPMQIEVDEKLFNALVQQHRDIPENIIDMLASNLERNNFIINDYLSHRDEYGKTIIFVDRWFQCLYIKDKLLESGVQADAIFYQNDNDPKVRSEEAFSNKEIIESFRNGGLQVLLNVKMFTEGADVPDVKTVFITRDTTSHILLQQMIGRALRGERAGGKKDTANIVLFGDNWDKTIAWASPETEGSIEPDRIVRKTIICEQISISLLEQLVKTIAFEPTQIVSYMDMIPVGWYQTEYVVFEQGMDSIELVQETVLIYPQTRNAFEAFVHNDKVINQDKRWAQEHILDSFALRETDRILAQYFQNVHLSQSFLREIKRGIIAIARHISQNRVLPLFFVFDDRECCNIESIANDIMDYSPRTQYQELLREYNRVGSLWSSLYPTFYEFKTAVDIYVNKILFTSGHGNPVQPVSDTQTAVNIAEEKLRIQAVKSRDNNVCGRCGLSSKETKLDVTYILPLELFGGVSQASNMQTLCTKCIRMHTDNRVNYTNHTSPLSQIRLFSGDVFDEKFVKNVSRIKSALRGSINDIYQCGAVFDLLCSRRSNSVHYACWTVLLHNGNNPEWLNMQTKAVISYIQNQLKQSHVKKILIQII